VTYAARARCSVFGVQGGARHPLPVARGVWRLRVQVPARHAASERILVEMSDDTPQTQTRASGPVDDASIEATILDLLAQRADTSSICPSDAARSIGGEGWRDLMDDTRRVARRLVAEGRVQITQGGKVVNPLEARGPIRIRWPRGS